jgi:hypothetical protein
VGTKTSGEIEREFIDNLKQSTGKNLSEWMKQLATSGIAKRNDLVSRQRVGQSIDSLKPFLTSSMNDLLKSRP